MPDWLLPALGSLGAGALGSGLVYDAYGRLGDIGETAAYGAQDLANTALQQTAFRPFTLTSATGGRFGTDAGGNSFLSTSPRERQYQQAMQQQAQRFAGTDPWGSGMMQNVGGQAFGLGQDFMRQAGQSTAGREGDIYSRIRAMQTPEEERQQLGLEERLASQGRLGVATNQYGGTPEQLAMDRARSEAMNTASFQAIQQAQQEQAQQAALGQQFASMGGQMAQGRQGMLQGQQALAQGAMQGSYIPQAALIDSLQPGLSAAGMAQTGQLTGAQMFGEASMGGLEALLQSGVGQANLIGSLGSGLTQGSMDGFFNWLNNG